ncbi:MAG TPA: GntR family transcriptional regulator [Gemmatimonadaceae bacterium]|nr:GntR family transcriptional regulator [Gemmatimonadaceae bacterium]
MTEPPSVIVETLRGRILRGLQTGTLTKGDRLPSTRDLVAEFRVDHRIILAAYRNLAVEGLVELRRRGGIYVAAEHSAEGGMPLLPRSWIVDLFGQALAREIPVPELSEWLRRSTETLRLSAAVIAATIDQAQGICRELRDDFGLDAEAVLISDLSSAGTFPLPIRRADVLLSTEAHAHSTRKIGDELKKPVITVEIRPDVIIGEWALLLRQPVYAIVATDAFGKMLRSFFSNVPGADNLQVLVLGKDDLSTIPDNAPTYVTQGARAQLGTVRVPGRILPAARTISTATARQLLDFIVRSNIEAMRSQHR